MLPEHLDRECSPEIDRVAQALNDEWAANPNHGAFWTQLEPTERNNWRDAAIVALRAYYKPILDTITPANHGELRRDG